MRFVSLLLIAIGCMAQDRSPRKPITTLDGTEIFNSYCAEGHAPVPLWSTSSRCCAAKTRPSSRIE
jgi:hypothetical protein